MGCSPREYIDFREGDKVDEKALKALIGAAVALNKGPKRCCSSGKESA